MDSFIDGKSPYEIMGVEKGSSAQAIKKVRRWC
jgi:curved DNA-binding protein CbpA